MAGFESFSNEWKRGGEEIVRIVVIDDQKSLEKMNYYKEYPFVIETVEANVYDKDIICSTINKFVSSNEGDTSILILSDDSALNEDIDAGALANLVYVRDIVTEKINENPDFDLESIDIIVEIIDPKHHDIVNNYNVNNVVISNRYISKMVTQISEFEALFDFYNDILAYDDEDSQEYESKEIYVKKVSRYFDEVPANTTAAELIRAAGAMRDALFLDRADNSAVYNDYHAAGMRLAEYLRGCKTRAVAMMLLDNSMRERGIVTVYDDVIYSTAAVKMPPFIKAALAANASVVITAQNYPRGPYGRSESDLATSIAIEQSFAKLGIAVAEHYVITGDTYLGTRRPRPFAISADTELERFWKSKERAISNGEVELI
jgi:DNA repair protein RadC